MFYDTVCEIFILTCAKRLVFLLAKVPPRIRVFRKLVKNFCWFEEKFTVRQRFESLDGAFTIKRKPRRLATRQYQNLIDTSKNVTPTKTLLMLILTNTSDFVSRCRTVFDSLFNSPLLTFNPRGPLRPSGPKVVK